MIDTELVKKTVALMGSFDEDEIEKYKPFISSAALSVASLLNDEGDENDARVIQLAAAKAYNAICCIAERAESITSFTAGDITIKQNSDIKDFAEEALDYAAEDCRTLLKPAAAQEMNENNGFAFLGV